jgi:hypothetical protein
MLINATLYRYKGFDICLDKYHSIITCYACNCKKGNIKIRVIGTKKYALSCLKLRINELLNKGKK